MSTLMPFGGIAGSDPETVLSAERERTKRTLQRVLSNPSADQRHKDFAAQKLNQIAQEEQSQPHSRLGWAVHDAPGIVSGAVTGALKSLDPVGQGIAGAVGAGLEYSAGVPIYKYLTEDPEDDPTQVGMPGNDWRQQHGLPPKADLAPPPVMFPRAQGAQGIAIPRLDVPAGTGNAADDVHSIMNPPPIPRIAGGSGLTPPPPSDAPGRIRVIRDQSGRVIGASNYDGDTRSGSGIAGMQSRLASRLGQQVLTSDLDTPHEVPDDTYVHTQGTLGVTPGSDLPTVATHTGGAGGGGYLTASTPASEYMALVRKAALLDAADAASGQPTRAERAARALEQIKAAGKVAEAQAEQQGRLQVALAPQQDRRAAAQDATARYNRGLKDLAARTDIDEKEKADLRAQLDQQLDRDLRSAGIDLNR